jgi:hypothetical protein
MGLEPAPQPQAGAALRACVAHEEFLRMSRADEAEERGSAGSLARESFFAAPYCTSQGGSAR